MSRWSSSWWRRQWPPCCSCRSRRGRRRWSPSSRSRSCSSACRGQTTQCRMEHIPSPSRTSRSLSRISIKLYLTDNCHQYNKRSNPPSGCGLVGRAIASDDRGQWFDYSHRQDFIMDIFTVNCWKDGNKEKRGREWPNFFNKRSTYDRKLQL